MATREVGPDSTVPGTRAWAETVAANARRYAGFTEKDVRPLVERYRQLCDHEAWELWYPSQLEARERFFRDVLGYEAEFLDMMSKGVEILDGHGHQGPVPQQAAEMAVLADRGRPRKGSNPIFNPGRGSTYDVRRLRRDRPDLAERVERREMSANAAAIEAGFRPKKISVPVTRPEAVARSLLKYMSADDIAKLVATLIGLSANQGDGSA